VFPFEKVRDLNGSRRKRFIELETRRINKKIILKVEQRSALTYRERGTGDGVGVSRREN
jgi:hypothetical protein